LHRSPANSERFSGRFVALKVMLDQLSTSIPHVHQFVREAVITARLQHTNIIPVYDIGFIEGNQLYYTMRYVEGEPFGRMLGSVSLTTRLAILQSAARAVDYAHVLGLWHRDLKPENILIHKNFDRNGEVFVIDWGLVTVQAGANYKLDLPDILIDRRSFAFEDRLLKDTNEAITTMHLDLSSGTGRGGLIGTPTYMAPEQCRNDQQNMGAVSDVWAFGVMLFEAMTGEHPIPEHRNLGPREIAYRVLNQDYASPRTIGEPHGLLSIGSERTRRRPGPITTIAPLSRSLSTLVRFASNKATWSSGFLGTAPRKSTTEGLLSRRRARRVPKSVSAEITIRSS
jgi:serine/threonine protein kinase